MKQIIIITTLLCLLSQGSAQTTSEQAEQYYQTVNSQQNIEQQIQDFWEESFTLSNINFTEENLVEWKFNNGWYLGSNQKSLKNGTGVYYFSSNGGRYLGNWKDDNMSGLGTELYQHSIYTGFYKDDKQHGFGIKYWPQEAPLKSLGYEGIVKYVGEYKMGRRHGFGILYFKDGSHESGIWVNSELGKKLPKCEVLEKMGF